MNPGGNGQSYFAVDTSSGVITATGTIDYEAVPVMYLVVQAVDGGTPSLSSSALVRITVIDLNDNTPVPVPDNYAVTVLEDVAVGTTVATVAATDADSSASNNNVIVFSLTSSDFQVSSITPSCLI